MEKYSSATDINCALKVAKATQQKWPAAETEQLWAISTFHACTLSSGTISHRGQGDAAKLSSMQQPYVGIVSQ